MSTLHRPVKTTLGGNAGFWALSASCLGNDWQEAGPRRCVLPRALNSDRLYLPLVADLPRHANCCGNAAFSLSNHLAMWIAPEIGDE